MKILLNGILTLCFGAVSVGAFVDGRSQALPIAIIFAGFAIYSAVQFVKHIKATKRAE
jgi:hypothetical protein